MVINTDLIIWFACKAGYGGEVGYNFATISYEKGAKTVLAWDDNIDLFSLDNWMWCVNEYYDDLTIQGLITEYDDLFYGTSMASNHLVSFGYLNIMLEDLLQ